jgi:hypothetical protein
MKSCADCKHYQATQIFEWCLRNKHDENGGHGTSWSARRDWLRCGPAGVWFERRPTAWQRLRAAVTTNEGPT